MSSLPSIKLPLVVVFLCIYKIVLSQQSFIMVDENIQLIPLADSIYIHTTYQTTEEFGRFGSNGLIIVKNRQAVLVDTPMDNEKTEQLVKYLEDSLLVQVVKLIVCHYHDDCMGGIKYIHSRDIPSIANSLTIEKCMESGLPKPMISFADSMSFNFNGIMIECLFPGGGHTFDNITVWIPSEKILFGGCLVKAYNSQNLGNTKEAVVSAWENSIYRLQLSYPDVKVVVPGHGSFGGPELLSKTIELLKRYN